MKTMKSLLLAASLLAMATPAFAADSYTSSCRIVQMPTGSNDTTWGTKANAAFAMLDACTAGSASVSVTAGNVTLSTANNAADQARMAVLTFTGTPGATRTVTMPNVSKTTWVINGSDSPIIFTAGAGNTVQVASSGGAILFSDGATNVSALANISLFGKSLIAAADAAAVRTLLGAPASADVLLKANNLSDLASASTARTNLGVAIGTDVQAYNANLAALAGLTGAANNIPYFTGPGAMSQLTVSTSGNSVLTGTAAQGRTALGLGTAAVVNIGNNTDLVPTLNAAIASDAVLIMGGSNKIAASGVSTPDLLLKSGNLAGISNVSTARSNLGLGNMAPRSYTVSTSAPSGGANDGDVWYQY